MNERAGWTPAQWFRVGLLFVLGLFAVWTAIRVAAPDDLGFRDQSRPTSYIADVVQNHRWLCPRDAGGGMASKPPLHPWIGAVAAYATGGLDRFAWLFPSILAMFGLTWTLYATGVRRMGWSAGLLAATVFLVSPFGPKMIGMIRTDSLFAWLVLLNALAALRAWETGRGWGWFWFLAFLGTMTKGPLALLLAVCGLAAVVWEYRTGHRSPLRGSILPGAIAWVVASGTWLWLAWREMGDEVIREMIGRELLRHAAVGDAGEIAGSHFYDTPFYFLTRFVPWSFFAIAGIVRVVRHPAADDSRRRFDRFMASWVVIGLIIFSMAGHQRSYLIFPLIAPSAWLAAGVLAELRWFGTRRRALAFSLAIALLTAPFVAWSMFVAYPRHPWVQRGLASRDVARMIERTVGRDYPVVFSSPLMVQLYLGLWRKDIPTDEACRLLAGEAAAFVAHGNGRALIETCREQGVDPHVFYRWDPSEESTTEHERLNHSVVLVGNRDRLEPYHTRGRWLAPFRMTERGIRHDGGMTYYLDKTSSYDNSELLINGGVFLVDEDGAELGVTNTADRDAILRLDLRQGGRAWREEYTLAPGQTERLHWPAAPAGAAPGTG